MKIIFCGPPHSGKSVFIANLIDKLPSDAYTIIRACPDGEGTWSNNQNQNETSIVRKKGKFTKSFIDKASLRFKLRNFKDKIFSSLYKNVPVSNIFTCTFESYEINFIIC